MTSYEWLRAYTALSRSGLVTEEIRACGSDFMGNPAAIEAIRKAPGYDLYVRALRSILVFPLAVYRVTTAEAYEAWRKSNYSSPVATTVNLEFARLVQETFPVQDEPLVLIKGIVLEPEAVVMRGRIQGYEIVVDSGRVNPLQVSVVSSSPPEGLDTLSG